ncbi:hypothetical protein [Halorubrum ezzemoulense]|uniref:hypothetical protein n=1 Tax=Halorubrum ezzemoulense TaxID=337243 RepID=UPI00232E2A83|nr:hypothetical protein [Halorubrum ezzemoulense]MDB9234428.1 hypothetical protein [Halorubrum ezzemoulense]
MSDDRDWRQYTRRGALGLMGLGGLAVASETLGFSTVTSDRGVSLTVASDDSAALQIEGTDESGTTDILENFGPENAAVPALDIDFTNDSGSDASKLNVTVSVASDSNSGVEIDEMDFGDTSDVSVSPGDSYDGETNLNSGNTATLSIDNPILDTDDTDNGQAEIDLSVSANFVNGISLSLNRGTIIDTPVDTVSPTIPNNENNTVNSGTEVTLEVTVENYNSDGINNVEVEVDTISSPSPVSGLNEGDTSNTNTSGVAEFSGVSFSDTGTVNITFDADGVTNDLEVTVE